MPIEDEGFGIRILADFQYAHHCCVGMFTTIHTNSAIGVRQTNSVRKENISFCLVAEYGAPRTTLLRRPGAHDNELATWMCDIPD